jgi:methionyl-tRNA synthetase
MTKPIVVTAALPYANGSIHIGHLLEYISTDVYVRALRMAGEDAYFFCADDTHGTPIEVNASKAGIPPEQFIARYAKEHMEDFDAFQVRFDNFDSTNSDENRRWANEIYGHLKAGGYIKKKPLTQLYDPKANRFLPDRFVKGTCPSCGAKDQYGDVCEVCSKTYEPTDLKDPYSVLTGVTPVLRESTHLFVDLSAFTGMLKEWVGAPGRLQPEIKHFVEAWIEGGLKDWCISRDPPYFGFEIPDEPGKYFYVWVDAPIGYISSTTSWAKKNGRGEDGEAWWRKGAARVEHVIGKDIVYFHTLFWPAMLAAADLTRPSKVHVHGMLTVDGVKMSKSRGTFVNAATFRKHIDPVYLRFYYASKLGPNPDDVDLSLDEFTERVNSQLVNNIANLVARAAPFVKDKLGGRYGKLGPEAEESRALIKEKVAQAEAAYRSFDLAGAVRASVDLANHGNKLFQDGEPWKLAKTDQDKARDLVTLCLNLARAATVIVAPCVPSIAEKIYPMLGLEGAPQRFSEALALDLVDRPIGTPGRVIDRIERKQLDLVIEDSKPKEESASGAKAVSPAKVIPPLGATMDLKPVKVEVKTGPEKKADAQPKPTVHERKTLEIPIPDLKPPQITIDDFTKIDLRVGKVVNAELVQGADKLLRLKIDLGEVEPRNILAGIRSAYTPEQILGKSVIVVSNLAPRKMRGEMSEGMVLAAETADKQLYVLTAEGAPPGSKIR